MNRIELARYIDHTLLKPDARSYDIERLCNEAKDNGFYSVCINPYYVSYASGLLKDYEIKVCTVVGFPLGASELETKVREAAQAIKNGAEEIDMVMNIGAFLDGKTDYVKNEIAEVKRAVGKHCLKVIIEIGYLDNEGIKKASKLVKEAGADFVKTATGFGPCGATVDAIRLIRDIVGKDFGVKAAGGIRDYKTAIAMIRAGANRLGCSRSLDILKDAK